MPKIKGIIGKHKKTLIIGLGIVIAIMVLIVLYKALFYSTAEKSVYGARLRDYKKYEISNKDRKQIKEDAMTVEGISEVKINIKGRLIKYFVTVNEGVSTEEIKAKLNEMLGKLDDKTKGYYDITFYVTQTKDGSLTYPIIGYKHKEKELISFDVH